MAVALVGMIASKLGNILNERLSLAGDVTQELENLSSEFKAIQAVLHDAECKQITEESVRHWLAKLKAVAYDLEDVLDESIIPALTSQSTNDGDDVGSNTGNAAITVMNMVVPHLGDAAQRVLGKRKNEGAEGSSLKQKARTVYSKVVSWDDVAQRVKELRFRLDQIAKEKNYYAFKEYYFLPQGGRPTMEDFETSSMVDESKIIGREAEKGNVIDQLVSGTNQEDGGIDVIAIIGVGGMGKTTLAQLISQDERVKQHFEKVLWVFVSDNFDVKRIMKAIIQDDTHHASLPSELNPLQKKLVETLQGKLFLLILDDMWNEDEKKWNNLRLPLQRGAQGSKILITTRSKNIASMMSATHVCELNRLSDERSWSLFSSKAFGKMEVENQLALEEIGKEIVKKCSGVPLSLEVMGSALRSKRTIEDWHNINESEIWDLPEVKKVILPAFLMSYNNLPAHLKQCFAYCSIFPKNSLINKDKLVKMWVAQGFIQSQGSREMENIADEYFNDLLARSMFQDLKKFYWWGTTCKMHDLLHDLAAFITEDESLIFKIGKSNARCPTNNRHVAIPVGFCPPVSDCAEKLRTLLIYNSGVVEVDRKFFYLFQHAKFLRVLELGVRVSPFGLHVEPRWKLPKGIGELKNLRYLNLSGAYIQEHLEEIGELKHLRYLNFSETDIRGLSKSICELQNLRDLNLSGSRIKELPESIGELKHLKYLNLSQTRIVELPESVCLLSNLDTMNLYRCYRLRRLPRGMSKMKSLRHLHNENLNNLESLPKGLGKLTSLITLPLFILGGEEGCDFSELKHLNDLRGSLRITKLGRLSSREESEEGELWRKSHLHKLYLGDLPRLCDTRSEDIISNDDVLEGLGPPHSNLQVLSIRNYNGLKLPTWLDDLPFSNLVELNLQRCRNCKELPEGLGMLPALKRLSLWSVGARRVSSEFYYGKKRYDGNGGPSGRVAFPKLQMLRLDGMEELEELEWPMVTITSEVADNIEAKCFPLLENLYLRNLPKLKVLPCAMWQLKELKYLVIETIPKLTSLPAGLGKLKKLKGLKISGLNELRYLPDLEFGGLEALERLIIQDCNALVALPLGLQRLTNLQTLCVVRCAPLTERCKRDVGADWTKIAHIPHVHCHTALGVPRF